MIRWLGWVEQDEVLKQHFIAYQRKIRRMMINHLKEHHPEWFARLVENGDLHSFLNFHSERAMAHFERTAKRRYYSDSDLEKDMKYYLRVDPIFESQRRINCPRQNDEPTREETQTGSADENLKTTERVSFPAARFNGRWSTDGLQLWATEHYPGELCLKWGFLLTFADVAQGENEIPNFNGPDIEASATARDLPKPLKRTGSMSFPATGLSIEWDESGLKIGAIRRWSRDLLLRWTFVIGLAEAAQRRPARRTRELGVDDICGKHL